jgi:GNAT superfamily N-acetyltransferase
MEDESERHGGGARFTGNAVVRLRQQGDIAACVRLLASVHATDGYPTRWPADPAAWLSPGRLLAAWVVERREILLGHIALCGAVGDTGAPVWTAATGLPPERIAEVARLFIAPDARGQGFGATLLETACAEARRLGFRPTLKVLDHDRAAIALYERLGWRRVASARMPWAVPRDDEALLHYYVAPD